MTKLQSILFILLTTLTQLSLALPEPKTTQEVADEIIRAAAQDSKVAQAVIIYVNLDNSYRELVNEWNAKYAHTDSSVVDYDEVKAFVDRVKIKYNNAKKYLYLTNKVKNFNHWASYVTESYRLLFSRGNIYLANITRDYSFRREIIKAMNSALLTYDEDILSTLDRMKDMIKNDIESDKVRESKINSK